MPWTGGTTRTTGTIVTAAMWNAHLGAGGDLDTLFDGTKIQDDLVAPSSVKGTHVPGTSPVVVDDDDFDFVEPFENEIAVWLSSQ